MLVACNPGQLKGISLTIVIVTLPLNRLGACVCMGSWHVLGGGTFLELERKSPQPKNWTAVCFASSMQFSKSCWAGAPRRKFRFFSCGVRWKKTRCALRKELGSKNKTKFNPASRFRGRQTWRIGFSSMHRFPIDSKTATAFTMLRSHPQMKHLGREIVMQWTELPPGFCLRVSLWGSGILESGGLDLLVIQSLELARWM